VKFLLIFLVNFLFAETIDNLLKVIQTKTDLSEKTKLENSGISIIYTRSDLDRMQVNTLKDIFISTPFLDYRESSYGFPDLFTLGDNKAFISNVVRVFIDNQEIATGMYGSGLMMLGDIDLDYVDHIEVYFQNPTYEYTTEPTVVLVKLYTKTAQKDNGGKIKFSYNKYNSKSGSIYYANELLNGWNYFSYFSYNQNQRKTYTVDTTTVSRDHPTYQALASIYNDNNRFLIQAISQNRDSFLDTSIDLTPQKATVDSDFIHMGYDGNKNNFYLLLDFDHKLTKSYFIDDVIPKAEYNYLYPIDEQISTINANLYNAELKYKYITPKNTLITGIKYRYKVFSYDTLIRNDQNLPSTGNTNQIVSSIFLENQHSISSNSIFNLGIMKEKVRNNKSLQQDDIFNYRFSHTYTTQLYTFKTLLGHTEISIDPYLVNSKGFFIKDDKVKKTIENNFDQEIVYKKDTNKFRLLFNYTKVKNQLIPDFNDQYLLYNDPNSVEYRNAVFSWTKDYNEIDKLLLSIEYNYNNLYERNNEKYRFIIRNLNTINKYDIFNELITTKTNDDNKYYVLFNAGIKYHYSDDFVVSLKGENIFNDSYKQRYFRADPDTLQQTTPVYISPIDQNFILSIEYYF